MGLGVGRDRLFANIHTSLGTRLSTLSWKEIELKRSAPQLFHRVRYAVETRTHCSALSAEQPQSVLGGQPICST